METNSLPEAPINDAGGPTGNMSEKDSNDTLSILRDEDPSQTDNSVTPADDKPNDDSVADDATADDSTSADDDTDDSTGEETQKPEENKEDVDSTAPPAPDTDPKFDKDLDDWATKRGYKLTDDSVRRIAQDARNAQRELRQKQDADAVAAKLNSVLGEEPQAPQDNTQLDVNDDPYDFDPDAKLRQEFKEFQNWTKQQLEQSTGLRLQSEFISSKNVTEAESEAMVSLIKSEKEAGNIEAVRYLSDPKNLPRLYQLAKLEMAENANTNDVAEQARAQERERLAKISQASGPNRSSKSTVTSDKKVDNIMAGLTADD